MSDRYAEENREYRARLAREVEREKVKATREQTAEIRRLRETLERFLAHIETPSEDTE